MKKTIYTCIAMFMAIATYAQIPTYYNDVDLTLTGMNLKNELATKITNTHTTQLTYTPGVWNVLKVSDLDPTNNSNVLLVYGYNDADTDITNDRSRSKNASGGDNGDWNREHIFPKSLGTPDLGETGPGSDAHNLKPADVQTNGTRGNKKYATGSGNAATTGANWYPGDEWKGDVARIYMYMYVRYNTQCKPGNACVGNPVTVDLNMVDLLLEWNAQDPVNAYEQNRNDIIANNQGNRNPFIDNPYLATLIWGGTAAENFWDEVSVEEETLELSIYPNPSTNGTVVLNFSNHNLLTGVDLFDITGKTIQSIQPKSIFSNKYKIENLTNGVYFVKISTLQGILTKKIIVK